MKTKNKTSLSQQVKELTELLQRTQANFENYRKQHEKRVQEIHEQAGKELMVQLLTVLDNFELALKSTDNSKEFVKGMALIYSQLSNLLEDKGLIQIKTKNNMFDPHFHEALIKIESDKPENMIIEELQKGFLLNNKVVRHAKVKISSGILETNKFSDCLETEVSKRKEEKVDEKIIKKQTRGK
jgi:molecular chaperone GrpE